MRALARKLSSITLEAPVPGSGTCLNCGAALTGPFCAQCGQRNIPPYPSVRELVVGTNAAMPSYADKLTADDLADVIAYLVSLKGL